MKTIKLEEIKRILFVRLRFIGDVIISTAVIRDLRKKYPSIQIDYLAEKGPLRMLENNPDIDNLVEAEKKNIFTIKNIIKLRSKHYDAVIDVFGNPRSALLTFFSGAKYRIGWNIRGRSFCYNTFIERKDILNPSIKSDCIDAYVDAIRLFGIDKSKRETKVYLSENEKSYGAEFKKKYLTDGPAKIVGIQPGCRRGESYTWPKERYAELADRLTDSGYKVLVFGGPADKETNALVMSKMKKKPLLVETPGIREDLSIMNICSCFVTNNHGPVHMAVALGIPTVGLYRADEVFLWFPYKDPKYRVLCNESIPDKTNVEVSDVLKTVKELIGMQRINGMLDIKDK